MTIDISDWDDYRDYQEFYEDTLQNVFNDFGYDYGKTWDIISGELELETDDPIVGYKTFKNNIKKASNLVLKELNNLLKQVDSADSKIIDMVREHFYSNKDEYDYEDVDEFMNSQEATEEFEFMSQIYWDNISDEYEDILDNFEVDDERYLSREIKDVIEEIEEIEDNLLEVFYEMQKPIIKLIFNRE